ncbi:alpha-E domain-containing protein [Novosphingopyxis baekryungensis]|jgi:uncharacterized alpha-E superfamily protein|uniref:alpha-E domain-containing protein n=1 Tax=Novosphingopyxis baekryungensis TaxID=279369 RepID=UPI0003B5737E|nr:alpha-E domain-containing protein [Novosphingopyxis baekryungensis]
MLGKTAGGLYWMARYMERSENYARLLEAGLRIAMTRSSAASEEWASVLTTAGGRSAYRRKYDEFRQSQIIDWMLRDRENPSSVLSVVKMARDNARLVRTALTREVWESVNECWMTLKDALAAPVADRDLPDMIDLIRRQSALVRGAMLGTLLRNDGFHFARLGTFIERADSTARIVDVKYFVLLPSSISVGSSFDNVQWETILRSVSAHSAYRWAVGGEPTARSITEFLLFNRQLPRSLAFCYDNIANCTNEIAAEYGEELDSCAKARTIAGMLRNSSIEAVFDEGLHEFLNGFLDQNAAVAAAIEQDYRFLE